MMDVGLVLPANLTTSGPSEDICHQVYLVCIVSKSIGRGAAKAKAEEEMKVQLEAKNFEIARHCNYFWLTVDGLTMLGGACRAELVEINPDETHQRGRRQWRDWGSIVAAITLGSVALAWSYFPSRKESSSKYHLQAPKPDSAAE
ncbi:hypothetical protein Ancab_026519 [Ancistrocladus abbreviatus]